MRYNVGLWAIAACAFATFLTLVHWASILLTLIYQRLLYPRRLRRRYDPRYLPRCSVIVPCKGRPRHAMRNLRAFARLNYPNYEVIYAVESESDPAVPLIRKVTARYDHASLVVAGLASTCAQKVHNLLAGVEAADAPEILVFADYDIAPARRWLRRLVLPLSDPAISLTTGFRWLLGREGTISGSAHQSTNMLIYVLFTSLSALGGTGLWGGTMALRRKDFERLNVASMWRQSVVDDLSLAQFAEQRGLKSILVPSCLTETDDALSSFPVFIDWLIRQLLYMKAYQRAAWWVGFPLSLSISAIYALLPIAIAGALLTPASFWEWGGAAPLIMIAGEMIAALLYALLGPVPHLLQSVLLAPVLRLAQVIGYFRTVGTSTITWSGVRYTFDDSGKVVGIER